MITRDFEAALGPCCLELTRLTQLGHPRASTLLRMGRRLSGSWDQGRAPPQGAGVRRAQRRGPTACTSTLGGERPRPRAPGRTGLGRRGSRPPAPGTLQATCWAHFTVGSLAPSWRLSSLSAPCRFGICCCAAVLLGFFCEDCDLQGNWCSANRAPLKRG